MRPIKALTLGLDLFNLFDAQDADITYFYGSRLEGEPADGVEDRHFYPVEPRQLRASVRMIFERGLGGFISSLTVTPAYVGMKGVAKAGGNFGVFHLPPSVLSREVGLYRLPMSQTAAKTPAFPPLPLQFEPGEKSL